LEIKKIVDPATKAIYESGHLPAGVLIFVLRWAVKLFCHWHHVAYVEKYGKKSPEAIYLSAIGARSCSAGILSVFWGVPR
jgi:hypothetical protein